jgi:calcineurin-like phosphoesterase family protein
VSIWLTADLHLDHAAIIGYTGRPFVSAHEMNGALVGNILETLAPTDTLYVLGDFAFRPEVFAAYAALLESHCRVVWVKGNHDPKQRRDPLAVDFKHAKHHFYCCHYPWATWRPNTVMLHGHCHGNRVELPSDPRQQWRFDVGVDTEWDGRKYYPVSIEQVEKELTSGASYLEGRRRGAA